MNAADASPVEPAQGRPTRAEFAAVALLLAALVFAAPALAALSAGLPAGHAWLRPFTGDEFHTLLLVEEPTVGSMLSKLGSGGDYNPPGLFLLLRPWAAVFGSSEPSLRTFSTVAMSVGLLGLYAALRGGLPRRTALAATLATWGGFPLLQVESVDARFYALWFAAAAWLTAAIPAFLERGGATRAAVVAGLSALVCLTHYFGVFSVAAAAAGQLFAERLLGKPLGRTLLRLAPTLAGPAAIAGCIPLYLGQRAGLEIPTWIAPSGKAAVEQLIDPFFRSLTLAGAALALAATLLWRSAQSETIASPIGGAARPLGAAFGFLGLPAILLVFHFLVQPVSVARYATPATLGVAAAAGILLACCDRRLVAAAAVLFALMPVATLRLATDLWDADRQQAPVRLARTLVTHARSGYLLVFAGRGNGYSAWRYSGLPTDAIRLASPDGQEDVSVFDRLERSVARRMNQLFAAPAPIGHAELRRLGPFVYCGEASPDELFPEADVRPVAEAGPLAAFLVTPGPGER